MNPVLVLGAGRSSVSLLSYLNDFALSDGFRFSVADSDAENLRLRTHSLPAADAFVFEASGPDALKNLIGGHKVVISLLPPPMHPEVARACLETGSNLVTASYESPEMREMADEIRKAGLVFINECGLDPGIDHMSAMEMMDQIRRDGGEILEFRSYCGGLVADECDSNPFRYKISWNPRNVVSAGKSGGLFLENGYQAFLPYQRLFAETEQISVPGWGYFEAYPNRDSTPYRELYGLQHISCLKRGTLRKTGFAARWNVLVQAGMTDESVRLQFGKTDDYRSFLGVFFPGGNPETSLKAFCSHDFIAEDVLDLFRHEGNYRELMRLSGTPADFLLDLILQAWPLNPFDKDIVVMLHSFVFKDDNEKKHRKNAWFGLKGEDSLHTAMARTVGLPLGIVTKLLLNACVSEKGLVLPLKTDIYQPVLKELSGFGISFHQDSYPI